MNVENTLIFCKTELSEKNTRLKQKIETVSINTLEKTKFKSENIKKNASIQYFLCSFPRYIYFS